MIGNRQQSLQQQTSTLSTSSGSTSTTTTFQLPSNVNLAIEVTTTGPEERRNRRYKHKCVRIQRQIKEVMFVNAALHAEVNEYKQRLIRLKNERKFLTNKLLGYQKDIYSDANSRILQQALSKKNNVKKYSFDEDILSDSKESRKTQKPS